MTNKPLVGGDKVPPFTLQRQRPNECLLASLCIYLGRDYQTVSDGFKQANGYAWGSKDMVTNPTKFLLHCLNVKRFCTDAFDIDLPMELIRADWLLAKPPQQRLTPNLWLNGGILIVNWPSYGYHAVAFDAQTNRIYDSAAMAILDLPVYIREHEAVLVGGWTK